MISRRRVLQAATGAAGLTLVVWQGRRALPVGPSSADPGPADGRWWLQLGVDGRLRVRCPVHELGQGASVGLAQIAAEELGLPLSAVDIEGAGSDDLPPLRMTSGSRSIATHARPMALAAATLRERLRALAAQRLGLPTRQVQDADAGFGAADGRRLSLAALARAAAGRHAEVDVAVDETGPTAPRLYTFSPDRSLRVVGHGAPTAHATDLVRGRPLFAADVHRPGLLHGRVLQAPRPGARLLGVDADAVRALPGVVSVVLDLADGFAGVVARTPGALDRAMQRLQPRWQRPAGSGHGGHGGDGDPSAVDVDAALARGALDHVLAADGEAPAGPWAVDLRLDLPPLHHAALEPRCAVAEFVHEHGVERLHLWLGSQDSSRCQRAAAAELGWPRDRVCLHRLRVGGAFGGRALVDVARDAWRLARAVGRPVKVQWTRADEFVADRVRPPSSHRVRLAVDAQGRLSQWWHAVLSGPMLLGELLAPRWAQPLLQAVVADFGATRGLLAPYAVPRRRVEFGLRALDLHTGPWRSLGATPNQLAIESAIDDLARGLGRDPVDFRLRQLGPEHARLAACLRRVQVLAEQRPRPAGDGVGRGYACGSYHGDSHVAACFEVRIDARSGQVRVLRAVCVQDTGLVINPDQVRAQVEGNLMMAIGQVLLEQACFDAAGACARRWGDYPLPGQQDVPQPGPDGLPSIEIELRVDRSQPPTGVGEVALVAAAPALFNALRDACGWRPQRLPVRPADLRAGATGSAAASGRGP